MPQLNHLVSRALFVASCAFVLLAAAPAPLRAEDNRARLIVLTDIGNEPDDAQSMVRLLLYSNDIAIEGLVASTSRHLPSGTNPHLIHERVDAYERVLPNLRTHDPRYPDASTLRALVVSGSKTYGMTGVGPGKDTDASRMIIAAVDRDDPRPVWVAIWGGGADLAQALWSVSSTRSSEELAKFVAKLRVYSISDQDDASSWARAYFPELFWVVNVHGFTQYRLATWGGISVPFPGSNVEVISKNWLAQHIQANGPLGALYPTPAYIVEGDTPSFLGLIPNGLNAPERPDWGGWGGRYEKLAPFLGLWAGTVDAVVGNDGEVQTSAPATIWRWRPDFQHDFATRMQWSVTGQYSDANHAPVVVVNGASGTEPLFLNACPNQALHLSAKGTSDPDGDAVAIRWSVYREASGLFSPSVTLSSDLGESTQVMVDGTVNTDQFFPPKDYQIHVIMAVTDNGTPSLTRYRRVVVTVPGSDVFEVEKPCAITPIPPKH